MSSHEMRQELARVLDNADENLLADMLDYAKERLQDSENDFAHETPEFFTELDRRVEATLRGAERMTLEEAEEVWAGKRPRP